MKVAVVFCHANGFCKNVWDPIISKLSRNLNYCNKKSTYYQHEFMITSFDFSFHGENYNTSKTNDLWTTWGPKDVLKHVDNTIPYGYSIIGIGYSLGVSCLVLAEEMRPNTFHKLMLFEPPMTFNSDDTSSPNSLSTRTLRRKSKWSSMDEARSYFLSKDIYRNFDKNVFDGYMKGGLRYTSHSIKEVTLCYSPEDESVNYRTLAHPKNIIRCPTAIMTGQDTNHFKNTWYEPHLKKYFPNGSIKVVPNADHFIPLVHPNESVSYVVRFMNQDSKL